MTQRTPILKLRLLNAPLPPYARARIDQLVKAKDLLRRYPQACLQEDVDIHLFHNEEVRYSGIQVDQYQDHTEWTAIGLPAVKALVLWYQIAQQEQVIDCRHVIESTEFYTPCFLEQPKQYRISNLILSKTLLKELSNTKSQAERTRRLEKYLFGNLMTFFNHIAYTFDKQKHFLKVEVHQHRVSMRPLPSFRQQHKNGHTIDFSINFQLPYTLRLGQATALGYGKVTAQANNYSLKQQRKGLQKC